MASSSHSPHPSDTSNITSSYATLNLADEETQELVVGNLDVTKVSQAKPLILIGKLITDKPVKFSVVRDSMEISWRPGKGMKAIELSPNQIQNTTNPQRSPVETTVAQPHSTQIGSEGTYTQSTIPASGGGTGGGIVHSTVSRASLSSSGFLNETGPIQGIPHDLAQSTIGPKDSESKRKKPESYV